MGQRIVQVDAFTNKPFAGNPAAVCILPEPGDETWMQNVVTEMNLSETTFLHRQTDGYDLRWFTPACEVDLCGHATLAGAHVLWQDGHIKRDETARFHTRSGLLTARRDGDWIVLDLPAQPSEETAPPEELIAGLGVTPKLVVRTPLDYLAELESEAAVRSLTPDFNVLAKLPGTGVIITARSDSKEFDFVSRYFAPSAGINEDPVTGAAHCGLGPYWQSRLDKNEFLAYQASSRGGVVRVKVVGDRVHLGGQAVTVLRGELET